MAQTIPKLNIALAETFQALPESLKDWLASDQCTVLISEINKKLGVKEERRRIIPRLLMRLILKDLEPTDFINELAGALNMNYQAAKALTQEIEQKVLNPIAAGLKRGVGVDIKLIYLGKEKPREEGPAPLEAAVPEAPASAEATAGKPASVEPALPADGATADKPAVIYKKGTFGRIPIAKTQPLKVQAPPPEKPAPVEITPPPAREGGLRQPPIPPPPSPAKAGFGGQSPPQARRIVHYSNFLTPLSKPKKEDIILEGNMVDLRLII